MSKYDVCKKCGEEAVHSANSYMMDFHGDIEDNEGNMPSKYYDEVIEILNVSITAMVCFDCSYIQFMRIEATTIDDDDFILLEGFNNLEGKNA